ncbi:hypothetical protein ACFQVC_22150 [Streptomyces monticola]|uniref:DUF1616 domain-containing protein n=1 Tax=Streptomyces monticola TaxID=2666263 RepID=A0ABW2JMX4_9ACTN
MPVFAGAAVAVGAVGLFLGLIDLDSPLRAPFVLFFLITAPAAATATALRRMEPWGRAVASCAAAAAIDLLVAQTMLALHMWSIRGGIAAVAAISLLIALLALVRRPPHGRPAQDLRRRAS